MNCLTSGEKLYRFCDPEPTLDLDVITEMRQIAGTMWTAEIDAMLMEDIRYLVSPLSRVSSGSGILMFCALKYHCTLEEIQERMEVIRTRTW